MQRGVLVEGSEDGFQPLHPRVEPAHIQAQRRLTRADGPAGHVSEIGMVKFLNGRGDGGRRMNAALHTENMCSRQLLRSGMEFSTSQRSDASFSNPITQ